MMVGACEYKMPKAMAKDLLDNRKGAEKKIAPKKYLIDYVNEQCGLLYECKKVILY